jgi:hypothetical protein
VVQAEPGVDHRRRDRSTTYKGPLIVGRDLMSFVISDKVEAFAANGDVVPPLMAAP